MATIETKLKETLHARTESAAQAAHDLVDKAARRAEISEEKLRKSADTAQRKLQSSLQTARQKGVGAKQSVADFMRRHPLASLGIALGAGVLLASRGSRARNRQDSTAVDHADYDEPPIH